MAAQGGLLAAITAGNAAGVAAAIEGGADVNGKHRGDAMILHAVKSGNAAVVGALVAAGANLTSWRGQVPPVVATCQLGWEYPHVLQALIDAGADVNDASPRGVGVTALQEACKQGHLQLVQLLLAAGADANATSRRKGGLALQIACRAKSTACVEALIQAGVDLDAVDGSLGSALEAAAASKLHVVLQILLEARPDGQWGQEALDAALCIVSHMPYGERGMRLLLAAGGHPTPAAVRAALDTKENRAARARILVEAGADVHHAPANPHHMAPCGYAICDGGDCNLLGVLMASPNFNSNAPGGSGNPSTLLRWAANVSATGKDRILAVVQMLLDAGADPNAVGRAGQNAMHSAAHTGALAALKLMHAAGGRLDAADDEGATVLGILAAGFYIDAVEWAVGQGADITESAFPQQGPLTLSCQLSNSLDILRRILALGADPNATAGGFYRGARPLQSCFGDMGADAAAEGEGERLLKIQALLEAGANPALCVPLPHRETTRPQYTLLEPAWDHGWWGCLTLLLSAGALYPLVMAGEVVEGRCSPEAAAAFLAGVHQWRWGRRKAVVLWRCAGR